MGGARQTNYAPLPFPRPQKKEDPASNLAGQIDTSRSSLLKSQTPKVLN